MNAAHSLESWHAVTLEIASEDEGIISHLLHEARCNGVLEEAASSPNRVRLIAYFDAAAEEAHALEERLRSALASVPSLRVPSLEITTIADNGWRESWRQWFSPFSIVPGIVVVPSWERYEPKSDESVLSLDPGMAFGTGLHATTRLCAEAISASVSRIPPPSLLDVGTGSGLLAMIARTLGVQRITAVENDLDALAIAQDNCANNRMADIAFLPTIDDAAGTFDIVVANILLLTLIELRESLMARLAPGGRLILSGITHDQEARILDTFSPPLCFCKTTRREEWSCMVFDAVAKKGSDTANSRAAV